VVLVVAAGGSLAGMPWGLGIVMLAGASGWLPSVCQWTATKG
jgi:hypothetical protein